MTRPSRKGLNMDNVPPSHKQWSLSKWRIVTIVNLALGVTLWFLYSTDFSLAGTIPDLVFPPLVGLVGLGSLIVAKNVPDRTHKIIGRLLCLPSIIGAGLALFVALLLMVPPFTLGTLFTLSEIADETCIQATVSPNGTQVAEVYFRGVGAYSGGNGRIFIRIKYPAFPLVERDIFYLSSSDADETTTDYLKWGSNDSLYISEIQQEIVIGKIQAETPEVVDVPINLIHYLIAVDQKASAERELTLPVRDVPTYTGRITDDQSQYSEGLQTVFRSFNIPDHSPDEIAAWYRQTLSTPPWSMRQINRYSIQESGVNQVRYCIQAQRDDEQTAHVYFWELMGQDDGVNGVHVNIGTPQPITDTCQRDRKQP